MGHIKTNKASSSENPEEAKVVTKATPDQLDLGLEAVNKAAENPNLSREEREKFLLMVQQDMRVKVTCPKMI